MSVGGSVIKGRSLRRWVGKGSIVEQVQKDSDECWRFSVGEVGVKAVRVSITMPLVARTFLAYNWV